LVVGLVPFLKLNIQLMPNELHLLFPNKYPCVTEINNIAAKLPDCLEHIGCKFGDSIAGRI